MRTGRQDKGCARAGKRKSERGQARETVEASRYEKNCARANRRNSEQRQAREK